MSIVTFVTPGECGAAGKKAWSCPSLGAGDIEALVARTQRPRPQGDAHKRRSGDPSLADGILQRRLQTAKTKLASRAKVEGRGHRMQHWCTVDVEAYAGRADATAAATGRHARASSKLSFAGVSGLAAAAANDEDEAGVMGKG